MSSPSSRYIVYWSPLSMPSRAVKQLLVENKLDAEYRFIDTIGKQTHTPEFLLINPTGQIPVLVDEDFTLAESSAILQYIVNKHQLHALWYPTDLRSRAIINQYLNWHTGGIRQVFARLLMEAVVYKDEEKVKAIKEKIPQAFQQLERYFATSRYIGSDSHPSIGDLQLYHELIQPYQFNLFDFSTAPKTAAWFEEFSKRPATIELVAELNIAQKEYRAKLEAQKAAAGAAAPSVDIASAVPAVATS